MFYCDDCAHERDWPETAFRSYGKCEMCNLGAECNDLPSKYLDSFESAVENRAEIEAAIKSIKNAVKDVP